MVVVVVCCFLLLFFPGGGGGGGAGGTFYIHISLSINERVELYTSKMYAWCRKREGEGEVAVVAVVVGMMVVAALMKICV